MGAGAAVIGAIAGSAISLGREVAHLWQFGILGLAAIWLLGLRRQVVPVLHLCRAGCHCGDCWRTCVTTGVLGAIHRSGGQPPYSASVTWLPQCGSPSVIERWVMKWSWAAPCQCSSASGV